MAYFDICVNYVVTAKSAEWPKIRFGSLEVVFVNVFGYSGAALFLIGRNNLFITCIKNHRNATGSKAV